MKHVQTHNLGMIQVCCNVCSICCNEGVTIALIKRGEFHWNQMRTSPMSQACRQETRQFGNSTGRQQEIFTTHLSGPGNNCSGGVHSRKYSQQQIQSITTDCKRTYTQLMKAYVAEMSCSQLLLIESASQKMSNVCPNAAQALPVQSPIHTCAMSVGVLQVDNKTCSAGPKSLTVCHSGAALGGEPPAGSQ